METKMMMLWLVVAAHFWCNSMCSPFATILRSVVNGTAASTGKAARIQGANGLCLDVKGGIYCDFNPVILWRCKAEPEVNQMWTFESDGTIRSNDWCLSKNTNKVELDMVVILNCYDRHRRPYVWKMEDNGLIVGQFIRKSNVLSAFSGEEGSSVHVTVNRFSSLQTWYFGGFEWRCWGLILGENGRCLEGVNVAVCLGNCFMPRRWIRFPDGTIRPVPFQDVCLGYNGGTDKRVATAPCEQREERWLFRSGTILNERDNLVMEARATDEIVANQKWEWKSVGD